MRKLNICNYEFVAYKEEDINIVFSTSKNNLNFNKRTKEGKNNLDSLKKIFKLNEVIYLNQIHSDIVRIYENDNITDLDGDGIITSKNKSAIGVFTADCVPVIIIDNKKKVIAAVHSGWKGTFNLIVTKTIEKIIDKYHCDEKDLKIYIGPHNRQCCYEVSEDLIEKFKTLHIYRDENINNGRYLNLEECIKVQLAKFNIKKDNIYSTNICTYCNSEYELYSYRKEYEKEGRLFSFVYIE
ncbi:MAG: peptidoglycan editing factor PgeF [Clostridium argentinense]|uniref:Purine nucleoside phosphorylase n=1 Tax=Clostridium faecium TaxID=2762223 RepID=A0ABR8YPI2_9CLOT|nr:MULTISPECIES: peptidoglycan editing factor PgeF [Clostridium]MBD8046156.1 peptidoglycan editing factor PgeF [Clostridium faecium]MBS5823645.1 peptidoglycan editing factor PgeF [Clostridium argentinense]MDU1347724.1 peptidoglycan editing factor PgeF [Clostridium argentinense]